MSPGTPPRHHGATYGASASKAKKDEVAVAGSDESTEQTISPAPPKRAGQAATKNNDVKVSKTLLGFIAAPKAPLIPYRRDQQDRKAPAHRISGKGLPLNFGKSQQPPSTSSPTPASHATPTAVVKAIIASNPQSKPQRYDGFPGVPAYIGAPDVIIFTPRSATPKVSPTTASGRPDVPAADGAQSPSFFSPIVSSSGSDSTRRNDDERMTFIQCWLLSGVALSTSVLPLGLLLLAYTSTPYSSTSRSRTTWTIVGSTTNGTTVSRSVFTLPVHTYKRSDVTAVPASCLRSPRQVSDQNPLLAGAASLFTASPKAVIFCLYNNSRYSKSGRYDFGPEQLPLPYCSNIVYWSLGMDDGVIRSRAPQFDLTHGLGVLRQNMLSHGIANATLLVALGGYSEDAPQFSRLGADARAMSRFTSSVIYLLRTYHLDGVALHWIGPELGCQGAGDVSTMTRVVRRVRQAILASRYTGLVTLIIPAEDVQSRLSSATVQAVDYIFLETQLPLPALLYSLSHCTNFAAITKDAFETVPGYANNKRKICAVYSLAPLLLDTVTFGIQTEYIMSNASRYSGVDGKGTVFEMCEDGACLSSPDNMSCIVLKNIPASPDGLMRSYVFYDRETIFNILTHGDPNKQFVSGDSCLLLYDVDLDNFNAPCILNRTFNSLHHFHASMERAAHLATPLLAARSCQRS
ncbi:hypothetical protein HPB50_010268 [Hyalomma asiaticum]|uniref:Uncharacterized protein n=1 Tax=Hyalomma asiaticum TaxID=266040 RepID=A0ACB7STJ8_HYAAI|nr:hypothetical protein HPB50_010268 [Hyalomma asiaticum]